MIHDMGTNIQLSLELPPDSKPLDLVWVEAGSFTMGARDGEPGSSPSGGSCFSVKLTNGFWIGRYPVTQAQWVALMGTNPSFHLQGGPDCPVENVSWHEAMAFCDALNEKHQRFFPPSFRVILPTEAQWEYACRAGSTSLYGCGDTEEALDSVAWYSANSNDHTHPVGMKCANNWGIHDMLGNVDEWCFDPYAKYPIADQVDWIGNASPIVRSFRSDCFGWPYGPPEYPHRCSRRGYAAPDDRGKWRGFRICVRSVLN